MHIGYWWENHKEIDQGVGGWIITKYILREIEWDGMVSIDLAQGRDKWRALVRTVMNLLVT
jgi:hypothetical protein